MGRAVDGVPLTGLTLQGRIDTDPDRLSLPGAAPLDDNLPDPVPAEIAQSEAPKSARFWVGHFAEPGVDIRDHTLTRLTAQGIHVADEEEFISFLPSVLRTPRYPADQALREDAQLRFMRILFSNFSNDIPDPHDAVNIGLTDACGAFQRLLAPAEREVAQEFIALLGHMDLVGRAVSEVIPRDTPTVHGAGRVLPMARPPVISVLLGAPSSAGITIRLGPIFEIEKNALARALEAVIVSKQLGTRDSFSTESGLPASRRGARWEALGRMTRPFVDTVVANCSGTVRLRRCGQVR